MHRPTLGIIGGGQLGSLLADAAKKIGIKIKDIIGSCKKIKYIKYKSHTANSFNEIFNKKYKINKNNILGHSDIAPDRKKDPGEKFPWKFLSTKKIGLWHKINLDNSKKLREKNINLRMNFFLKQLKKFGYCIKFSNSNELRKIIKSFQRRFRPELVNGKSDKECLEIIKSLI